ncbi:MAG: hypothetical protein WKG00_07640 [Polyangiaceae bacterium]
MRYQVLCTDYDGTIAHDGVVDEATVAALERLLASGRRLVLVTWASSPSGSLRPTCSCRACTAR